MRTLPLLFALLNLPLALLADGGPLADGGFEPDRSKTKRMVIPTANKAFSVTALLEQSEHFEHPVEAVYNALGKGIGHRHDNWPLKLEIKHIASGEVTLLRIYGFPTVLMKELKDISFNIYAKVHWIETKHFAVETILPGNGYYHGGRKNFKIYKRVGNTFKLI